MNSVTYRRLTEEDLAIFIEMRITQLREPLKDDCRDDRRGLHPLEPSETAVRVLAGKDLVKNLLVRSDILEVSPEMLGDTADIISLGQGKNILS